MVRQQGVRRLSIGVAYGAYSINFKNPERPPMLWRYLDEGNAIGFFIWRNPSDVVPSMMKMFGFTFSKAMASMRNSATLWRMIRRHPRVLTSSYEYLTKNIAKEALRYLHHLGVMETPESGTYFRELAERYSLSCQRERVASIEKELSPKTARLFDEFSMLHPQHIQSPNGWCQEMSGITMEQYRELKEFEIDFFNELAAEKRALFGDNFINKPVAPFLRRAEYTKISGTPDPGYLKAKVNNEMPTALVGGGYFWRTVGGFTATQYDSVKTA
jgi:hypothetical protein